MAKQRYPTQNQVPAHDPVEIRRDASACGTNSKDPQRTESFGSDGVGDSSTNAADVTGTADDLPCADRVPTDGANCRGCSSAMPSDRGLGLMESCKLTRDIGSQTSGESDLPRFGALDEVKPLRPACLILIMKISGYNGVPKVSAVISSRG